MVKKYYIKNLNELLKKLNTAEELLRKSLVIGRLNNKDGDNDILNCVELKIIKA